LRISEQIARRGRGLGVAAVLMALAGCAGEMPGRAGVESAPASAEMTRQGDTVFVRSTRPRILGQLVQRSPGDVGPARDAALVAAAADAPPAGDAAAELNRGARLAFGDVARVCSIRPETRGQEVGRPLAGFRLYDTAPGSAAPRTMFLAGFEDGCARAFTGTLAQLAPVSVHEAVRYAAINESPWSASDLAYEAVRAERCGVASGAPCPAPARRALIGEAAFVSVYDGFGPEAGWRSLFLHDGALVTAPPEDG
jgi:hypothetical protein